MTDINSADQAQEAFYSAFENGDLDAMAVLWDRSDTVVCVHPNGPELLGYEEIMESWREVLGGTSGFRITVEILEQFDTEQLAVRFVAETLFNEAGRSESVTVLATNAYRKTESGWHMVLHHASPLHRAAEEAGAGSAEDWDTDVTLH